MFTINDRPELYAPPAAVAQFERAGRGDAFDSLAGITPTASLRADRVLPSLFGGNQGCAAPPFWNAMPFGSLLTQLFELITRLLGMVGSPAQTSYTNANASSTGDPHLAFDGTAQNGQHNSARFDSMQSHQDLLDSNSFLGGYRISTVVTAPQGNGVTFNQSATVTSNFGNTAVTLDKNGNASIQNDGETLSIANGQTLTLGNGETVTRNADGSLTIEDYAAGGGTLTTTMHENGAGVDVNVQAQNVQLGGDLVTGQVPVYRNVA